VATERFQKENPIIVKSVAGALEEAQAMIGKDKRAAAQIMLENLGRGWELDEVLAVLQDPDIQFGLTPQNVKKYADFMADIGSIKNRLTSWKDMFFQHVHELPGS
jgi:NitT/TauT family transport system substrate-binding protein